MDEQKTQTSAQPEHIPLLLIARELWRKLGLILMFAATVAACGYIAATLLYRPVYQTQTTFVVSVRNGSTVYANLNTASTMAETLSTFFEGDVMRKCITNDIGAVSGTIKAKQIPETNLLTMTVSAPTQRDAHRITQSVLRNYNEQANKLLGDVALDVLCRPTVPGRAGQQLRRCAHRKAQRSCGAARGGLVSGGARVSARHGQVRGGRGAETRHAPACDRAP